MNRRLQPFAILLRQPFRARQQIRSALFIVFGLTLSGVILTISLMIWGYANTNYAAGFGIAARFMVVAWWYVFVSCMHEIALPQCLQLLPHFKSLLRYATAAMWLLATLLLMTGFEHPAIFCLVVFAVTTALLMNLSRRIQQSAIAVALAWVVYGVGAILWRGTFNGGTDFSAVFIDNAHTLLLYFALAASAIGIMAVFRLTPALASPILFVLIVFYIQKIKPNTSMWTDLSTLRETYAVHTHALLALSAIFFVWMLAALTGRWRIYVNTWSIKLGELNLSWAYSLSLTRILKRSPSAEQLMPYLFGQMSFWGTWGLTTTVGGCCALLLSFLADQYSPDVIAMGLSFIWILFYIISSRLLYDAMYANKREQALLSLAPGFMPTNEQNQWVWKWLIHRWLGLVIFSAVISVAYSVSHAAINEFAIRLVLALVVQLLGMLAVLMHDYSCSRSEIDFTHGLLVVFTMCLLPLIMLISRNGQLVETALVVFTITLAIAVYRYRRMMHSPHAFPVGRLASDEVR